LLVADEPVGPEIDDADLQMIGPGLCRGGDVPVKSFFVGGCASFPENGAGSEIIEGIRVPDNEAVEHVPAALVVREHLFANVDFSQLARTVWDRDESEAIDVVDPDLAGAFEGKGKLSFVDIDSGNEDAVIFLTRLAGPTVKGDYRKQGQKKIP